MAMKRVKIAELKDHLSEHLRAVENGELIEVTDRQRPIVRLVPVTSTAQVRLIPAAKSFKAVRGKRYGLTRWPKPSLGLLLEERGKR
jgi:prevent-host-death family protein